MSFQLVKVGSAADNNIVLKEEGISRYHAELFLDEDGNIFITDLDSTNGTFVNGNKIDSSMPLQKSDRVQLADEEVEWKMFFSDPSVLKDTKIKTKKSQSMKATSTPKKKPVVLWALFIALAFIVSGFVINELMFSSSNDASSNASEKEGVKEGVKGFVIPEEVTYNYDCLGTEELSAASDLESQLLGITSDMTGVTVSVDEEMEMGQEMHRFSNNSMKFLYGDDLNRVKEILNKLIPHIQNPKGFDYKIYVIKEEQINAFTVGGLIYVTSGMLDFVQNNNELACVIGHEIAHNEQGHIANNLKKFKISTSLFGDELGSELFGLNDMFTQSFNQKKETESDFYGIGYAFRAGYKGCESITVWERMSESEDDFDQLSNIGRSHPFSEKRAECCRNHIEENYRAKCD